MFVFFFLKKLGNHQNMFDGQLNRNCSNDAWSCDAQDIYCNSDYNLETPVWDVKCDWVCKNKYNFFKNFFFFFF